MSFLPGTHTALYEAGTTLIGSTSTLPKLAAQTLPGFFKCRATSGLTVRGVQQTRLHGSVLLSASFLRCTTLFLTPLWLSVRTTLSKNGDTQPSECTTISGGYSRATKPVLPACKLSRITYYHVATLIVRDVSRSLPSHPAHLNAHLICLGVRFAKIIITKIRIKCN